MKREKLLSALIKTKPGLAKKSIIEQTTHFLFTGTQIITYNDNFCIMCPFETEESLSIKGEDFYKIIEGITEEDIEIKKEKDKICINSESTKAEIAPIISDEYNIKGIIEGIQSEMKEWKSLPQDFITGAFLSIFSTTKDAYAYAGLLSCIYINGKNITSTDRMRASWYKMTEEMPKILLDARAVEQLIKFKCTQYCESENWVHFKTEEEDTFSCRKVIGDFPDVESIFSKLEKREVIVLPENLKSVLDSIIFFSPESSDIDKCVQIEIKKGIITCRIKQEIGFLEKSIKFNYEGEDLFFYINPIFLFEILGEAINMQYIKEEDFPSVLFEKDNFRHIIALRIE